MTAPIDAAQLHADCLSDVESIRREALDRLGGLMVGVLRRRVGADPRREHLAADCAQEALFVVWRKLSAGHGPNEPSSFVAWALRIAMNRYIDAERRLEPRSAGGRTRRVALSRQVRLEGEDDDDAPGGLERTPDPGAPDAQALAENADLRALLLAVAREGAISDASRTVLLRGFLEEWEDAELAEHLETTRANVHVIRCRDLAKLRADETLMARLGELRP